eukprot:TCONS_00047033-protein
MVKIIKIAMFSLFITIIYGLLLPIPLCDTRRNLTPQQVKLCKKYQQKHLELLLDAKFISEFECEQQFSQRRWNCTLPPPSSVSPLLLPKMPLATRETAYIYASTSAAIMHTISRGCMEGKLANHCSCSKEERPGSLKQSDVWGGCGDNLPYGYQFSKKFTDAGEQLSEETLSKFSRVLMNLHNNEAGRWAVYEKSFVQCRCIGVSTNCAINTCYRQLGRFNKVAKHLENLYRSSVQVELKQGNDDGNSKNTEIRLVETNPNYNKYSAKDMVYIKDSPSYCEKKLSIGSYGVAGRSCTKTGNSVNDCNMLCCDRGYYSRREIVKAKCGCKLIWCCEVKCKTCEKEQNNHYCK